MNCSIFFKDQYTDIEKKRFCFELIDSSINTLGEAFKTAIPMDQRALARFLADSVEVGQSPYLFSSQQLQKLVNDSPDRVELCNDLYKLLNHSDKTAGAGPDNLYDAMLTFSPQDLTGEIKTVTENNKWSAVDIASLARELVKTHIPKSEADSTAQRLFNLVQGLTDNEKNAAFLKIYDQQCLNKMDQLKIT